MSKTLAVIAIMLILTLATCLCIEIDKQGKTYALNTEAELALAPFAPAVSPTMEAVLEPILTNLGEFTVYHYCPCKVCCSKTDGITATGTIAAEGRTIATDWDVIPAGSKVLIEDNWYIVEDSGKGIKDNKIDIYMDSHTDALEAGVKTVEVFVLEEAR